MPGSPYYDPEVRVAIEAVGSLGTIDACFADIACFVLAAFGNEACLPSVR